MEATSHVPNVPAPMMSSAEAAKILDHRVKEAVTERATTEANLKKHQDDLQKLLQHAKAPQRPRESQAQLDEQIAKLELLRTVTSMTLTAERDILKQINKLQQQKSKRDEFQSYDDTIKEHRAMIVKLREILRHQTTTVQELRIELTTLKTAVDLGCHVKDLVGQKMECPANKMGPVIGKNGKNIKLIETGANVTIDVQRKGGDVIHLIGTPEAIGKAATDIGKCIDREEQTINLTKAIQTYLTTPKITALQELRDRHPDVYLNVGREQEDAKMVVRGIPPDIQAVKTSLIGLKIMETTLHLTTREGGILIGKSGTTIANVVEIHQVAIDVQRSEEKPTTTTTTTTPGDVVVVEADKMTTRVTIIGPSANVTATKGFIENLVADNKDGEVQVSIDPNVRMTLLLNNGAAIQALRKRVNDTIKALLVEETTTTTTTTSTASSTPPAPPTTPGGGGGSVLVNIQDDTIVVKTRVKMLDRAVALVREEVRHLTSSLVKVSIDPFVIPLVIGKGGEGIKQLKEGTTGVNVEINREGGEVCVCGTVADEVHKVVTALEKLKAQYFVKRIHVQCDDDNNNNNEEEGSSAGVNTFAAQFRNFLRSAAYKEVQDLGVFMVADDAMKQIVLRGNPDNVAKATKAVELLLSKNYCSELCITEEDFSVLLVGGKESKIVELAAKGGVNLSTDRQRQVLIARGEKHMVDSAIALVREFLYGGENIIVRKLVLDDNDLKGVVIGKGGKTKMELEKKYPNVSINIHQSQAAITIRGPTPGAVDCHVEILTLILGASVSRSVDLTNDDLKKILKSNFHRRLSQLLKVQAIPNETNNCIVFRGSAADIEQAERLLKAETKGVYETGLSLGRDTFDTVKAANQKAQHIDHIAKVEKVSITLRESAGEIVLSGDKKSVCKAKTALASFLEFLLGGKMARCAANTHVMSMVGRPAVLAEIQARSNAQICIDQDLEAILVFSKDEEAVKSAAAQIAQQIASTGGLVHVIRLDESEGWLLSNVIGKSGAQIKKIRKEAPGCKIDVDSKQLQIIITGPDTETVSTGKKALAQFIDTARKECMFVVLPTNDMPAFVGRGGSHIRELAEKYEVELQIIKNQGNSVRITGPADKVSAAGAAIHEWAAARQAVEQAASAEEAKRIRLNQVPIIIGARGATISALTKEFGCRIDIDRVKGAVIARGGTAENRANLFKKIDELLSEQTGDAAAVDVMENPEDTVKVGDGKPVKSQQQQQQQQQPAPKRLEKPKSGLHVKQTTVVLSREVLTSVDMFPTLPGADGMIKQVVPTMHWPVATKPGLIGDHNKLQTGEEKVGCPEEEVDVVIMEARDWRQQYYGINL